LVTILSGALILSAALMLCVGGLALVYRFVEVELLQAHYGATGAIYAALYVMFGISLGFSLFLVWQQYEAAKLTVEAEAAAVQRIYWLAENYPDPKRSDVQVLAVSYAREEVQEEWPLMGEGQVSPHTEQLANQLARAVRELSPKTQVQSALYADALGRLDVLRENRGLRTTEVREGIPSVVWVVLVSGAVITVGFTYLFAMRSFKLHAVATGALTVVVMLLLFTVGVLDHAYDGDVRVGPGAFELALKEMKQ
jgi:amino acid transporter